MTKSLPSNPSLKHLRNEARELVIAFTDISGFATASETLPPEGLVTMLSEFYELTSEIVEGAGGTVVKFIGDSSLVVFPEAEAQRSVDALRQLKQQGEEHFAKCGWPAKLNIKANIGSVICVRVGTKTDKRLDVFGDAVNVAARLTGDGLVLSDRLQEAIAS